jgi:MFS family permease
MAARAALGIAEGGLFPGVTFYITMWYRRHECGFRMAIFFSAATAAGAFGGLLARGITEMDGLGGLEGWAWIFVLEGLLTFVVGKCSCYSHKSPIHPIDSADTGTAVIAFFCMHDYPSTAKFLTAEEKVEVAHRLTQDRSSLADEYNTKYMFHALKDWKIWVHMFITIGIYTPLYSVSLFMPTIVKGMLQLSPQTRGFPADRHVHRTWLHQRDSSIDDCRCSGLIPGSLQLTLLQVPPYVVACLFCISAGYVADKKQTRGIFMIGFILVA